MGGAHSQVKASTTSPTFLPYVPKQLTALFLQVPWEAQCSIKDKLRILVKAQHQHSKHLAKVTNKYSLDHCGLSAASRCKLAFTSRHYTLLTATDTIALHFFLVNYK